MTDFEFSYALMAVLYLMECCVLIPKHAVLFTRVFLRWRVNRLPGCAFIGGKRLTLLPPLPWAGEWHIAPSPDATVTSLGIITLNSLHEYPLGISRPRLLKTDDSESKLWLQAFADAGYHVGGKRVVLPFDKEAGGKGKTESSTAVDVELARWVDSGPARSRLGQLRGSLMFLKLLCTMQFLWAFAGAPLLLRYFSLEGMLLPYLFILFWLGGTIAASFAFTYRRLHGRRWKSFGKALWLFIYPLAAMRAVQLACNGALPPCHESAAAEALMRRKPGGAKARPSLRQQDAGMRYLADITAKLRHRLFFRSLKPETSQALGKANERLLRAIYANWGVTSVPPLYDPAHLEKEATCYCPVCGIGLAADMESCPHCLEVKILPK